MSNEKTFYKHVFKTENFDEISSSVNIYADARLVGILSAANGSLSFVYSENWIKNGDPLSPAMPLSGNFHSGDIHSYFDSFMPEGKRREIMASLDKLPASDLVGFLRRHGEDLPGNLHAEPIGKSSGNEDITRQIAKRVEQGASFARLPQHSLLSGVDDKIAVIAEKKSGNWVFSLSSIDRPSTHIIKKGNDLCVNEAFCMELARQCGLAAMPSDILVYNGQEAYITERFDRVKTSSGTLRLDQKDFCQLAGKSPEEKYYHCGIGLSNEDIVNILSCLPISETWKFLEASMFSLIIGNSDDHGKNYSLLYENKDCAPVLSPMYDIASISGYLMFNPQGRGTTRLARPIGHALYDADLSVDDLIEYADVFNVDCSQFSETFEYMVNAVDKNAITAKNIISEKLNAAKIPNRIDEVDFLFSHMKGRVEEFYKDLAKQLSDKQKHGGPH